MKDKSRAMTEGRAWRLLQRHQLIRCRLLGIEKGSAEAVPVWHTLIGINDNDVQHLRTVRIRRVLAHAARQLRRRS